MNFFERMQSAHGIALNSVQREAIEAGDGPLLLLACPGSGKTTTLITRIGWLLEERRVPASRIRAITFSRASARDMQARFQALFPGRTPPVFSTIHSLAFQIARESLQRQGLAFELIEGGRLRDPRMAKPLLLKALAREVLGEELTDDELKELISFSSLVKNRMIPRAQWASCKGPIARAGEVLLAYEEVKGRAPGFLFLDFDDLLVLAEKALADDAVIRERFQALHSHWLTDESQDTSRIQHAIIERLVEPHQNICVVADDDQSIYTWRGADPSYLLRFSDVYPQARILRMEQNYRSSKQIVEASAQFIQANKERYDKRMVTDNLEGPAIARKRFQEAGDQLSYVIYELLALSDLSSTAVLFRNNASSTVFVSELHRRGIPFYMKDADNRFFSHWVVEDVLNFMRFTFNDRRHDIFAEIALKMNAYISRKQVNEFLRSAGNGPSFREFLRLIPLKSYQQKRLEAYEAVYRTLGGKRPTAVIRAIRRDLGYDEMLRGRAEKFGYRAEALFQMLDTLEEIASGVRTMTEFAHRLRELAEAVEHAKSDPPEGAVTLSTLHSAKGLEFDTVFMIDLVQGVIPSEEEEGRPELLEEARRLFYVGMTRARSRLELLSYAASGRQEEADSTFVREVAAIIDPATAPSRSAPNPPAAERPRYAPEDDPDGIHDAADLREGLAVAHRVFGPGVIERLEGDRIAIRFGAKLRALDLSMVLDRGLLARGE